MDNFFAIFEIIIGVYVLYLAIMGKGKPYSTENIKKGKEEKYQKLLRIWFAVIGPLLTATGVLDYLSKENTALSVFVLPLWGVSLAALAAMMVMVVRLTDRTKKAANKAPAKGKKLPPSTWGEPDADENDDSGENNGTPGEG